MTDKPKFRKNQKNATIYYNASSSSLRASAPIAVIERLLAEGKINFMRHKDGTQSFWRNQNMMISFNKFRAEIKNMAGE